MHWFYSDVFFYICTEKILSEKWFDLHDHVQFPVVNCVFSRYFTRKSDFRRYSQKRVKNKRTTRKITKKKKRLFVEIDYRY